MMRLYDVKEGMIKADGCDIRDYDVKKYRDTIGTVFQDFQIFAGTVKENVILDVSDNADEDKVLQALDDSGLMERIKRFKS